MTARRRWVRIRFALPRSSPVSGRCGFGTEYARRLRRARGACSNIWHLDELCLMFNGERGWLWRAVDDAVRCSTSWCNGAAVHLPQSASFANC